MNLGMVRLHQKKYTEAEALFLRTNRMILALPPDKTDDQLWLTLGQCDSDLATIYIAEGKNAKAVDYLRAALMIRGKVQGPNHPDLVGVLQDYALALRLTHKFKEAAAAEARAKHIATLSHR
jgi:tetratricopeptide (TPR) repeat protein